MDNTLSDRVKWCMQTIEINNEQLARACGVSAPTAFNWANGKTKQIKAGPLLKAANLFRVRPEWLATGELPKYPVGMVIDAQARELNPVYRLPAPATDQLTQELLALFARLDKRGKSECLSFMRVFVNGRASQTDGQDLQVASS